jgi:hypothetical protein
MQAARPLSTLRIPAGLYYDEYLLYWVEASQLAVMIRM